MRVLCGRSDEALSLHAKFASEQVCLFEHF
jgi:hypothetical protein